MCAGLQIRYIYLRKKCVFRRESMCVCVGKRKRVSGLERERACDVCVRERERVCVREREIVCVCERGRKCV